LNAVGLVQVRGVTGVGHLSRHVIGGAEKILAPTNARLGVAILSSGAIGQKSGDGAAASGTAFRIRSAKR
jgi:hypothetical protein